MKVPITIYTGTGGSKKPLTFQKRGSFYIVRLKQGVRAKRSVKVNNEKLEFTRCSLSWFNFLSFAARNNWEDYAAAAAYNTGLPPYHKISGLNWYIRQCMWGWRVANGDAFGKDIGSGTPLLELTLNSIAVGNHENVFGDHEIKFYLNITANVDMANGANIGTKFNFRNPNTNGRQTSKAVFFLNAPIPDTPAGTPFDVELGSGIEPTQFPVGQEFYFGVYGWTEGNLSKYKYQWVTIFDDP